MPIRKLDGKALHVTSRERKALLARKQEKSLANFLPTMPIY